MTLANLCACEAFDQLAASLPTTGDIDGRFERQTAARVLAALGVDIDQCEQQFERRLLPWAETVLQFIGVVARNAGDTALLVSSSTGSSFPRLFPSLASSMTQSESTECADQKTRTQAEA